VPNCVQPFLPSPVTPFYGPLFFCKPVPVPCSAAASGPQFRRPVAVMWPVQFPYFSNQCEFETPDFFCFRFFFFFVFPRPRNLFLGPLSARPPWLRFVLFFFTNTEMAAPSFFLFHFFFYSFGTVLIFLVYFLPFSSNHRRSATFSPRSRSDPPHPFTLIQTCSPPLQLSLFPNLFRPAATPIHFKPSPFIPFQLGCHCKRHFFLCLFFLLLISHLVRSRYHTMTSFFPSNTQSFKRTPASSQTISFDYPCPPSPSELPATLHFYLIFFIVNMLFSL